jgi:hypothetical protein
MGDIKKTLEELSNYLQVPVEQLEQEFEKMLKDCDMGDIIGTTHEPTDRIIKSVLKELEDLHTPKCPLHDMKSCIRVKCAWYIFEIDRCSILKIGRHNAGLV